MKRLGLPVLLSLMCVTVANAGDIQLMVRDASGAPVENAVVAFTPDGGAAIRPADLKGPFVMAQQNVVFSPYVLPVPKGAVVAFPNYDRVNHHVYSFSPAQKFQLPLYGKGKSHTVIFNTPGAVALGCNIHDAMQAYIRVVDTPYYAKTNAQGQVTLSKLPETKGVISIWHPFMAVPNNEITQGASVAKTNAALNISIRLRPRGAK